MLSQFNCFRGRSSIQVGARTTEVSEVAKVARQIRTVSSGTISNIEDAMRSLKKAQQLLREAGAVKTLAKVESALKSAQGAKRHALRAAFRRGGLNGVDALLVKHST
jgi:hypothetical protein